MSAFRYQAMEAGGSAVSGVIEAPDRRGAIQLLKERGLFPSSLEAAAAKEAVAPAAGTAIRISRKEVTSFTREVAALLTASIPIPQALDGLGEEEESPAVRTMVLGLAQAVRKGVALSAAMEDYPKVFSRLYISMVRVGEEAGAPEAVVEEGNAAAMHRAVR